MKNYLIICVLIFILFSHNGMTEPTCLLLKKNVEEMKYEFQCGQDNLNIECEIKNKSICMAELVDRFEKKNYQITDDQLRKFRLFEKNTLTSTECELQFKVCTIKHDTCDPYVGTFNFILSKQFESLKLNKSCDQLGLGGAKKTGAFATELISKNEFSKKDCKDKSNSALKALDFKLAIFKKNLALPFSSTQGFFNQCLKLEDEVAKHKFLTSNTPELEKLRNRISSQTKNINQLKYLICHDGIGSIYDNDEKLSMDTVLCLLVEDARLSVNISDYKFVCSPDSKSPTASESLPSGKQFKISNEANLTTAATLPPVEQQPAPKIMVDASEGSVGLTQALANVDKVVPGDYSSSVSSASSRSRQEAEFSENTIASGAVRNIIPNDRRALQAGQAITPFYNNMVNIAKAAKGSLSPGAVVPIGKSSTRGHTLANPLPLNTVKVPDTNEASSATALNIAPGGSTKVTKDNESPPSPQKKSSSKKVPEIEIPKNSNNKNEAVPTGTPRPNVRGIAGGSSGGTANNDTTASVNSLSSLRKDESAATRVWNSLTKLQTEGEIERFFTQESAKIPELRSLIYEDTNTQRLLAKKGIRIVSSQGKRVGQSDATARIILSDNGKNFIPIKKQKQRKK